MNAQEPADLPTMEHSATRVLLAVDGSKLSQAATRAVIAQFHPQKVEIKVLTVIENEEHLDYVVGVTQEQLDQARELVDRTCQRLRRAGFKAEGEVYRGEARGVIIESAEEWNADLVMVGSHGRSDLTRFFLGSNSDAIAHRAPCSVEIVRGERAKRITRAKHTDLSLRKVPPSLASD